VLQPNLNQVFIACASQAGTRSELEFLGSSVLADPYGQRVLGPLSGSESEIAVAEIDLREAQQARVRSELVTPRQDRRTDLYGLWTADGEVL
jgi:N-carbamoylputrescine amidase